MDRYVINFSNAPVKEPERQTFFINEGRKIIKEKEDALNRKLTCHVSTFGCQMNARDSEKLRGILEEMGYENIDSEDADLVIFNTCSVRENADNKVYGRLGILHGYKDKNPGMKIGICGCMMQEPQIVEKIKTSYPFVDIMFGTHNIHELAEIVVKNFVEEKRTVDIWDEAKGIVEDLPCDRTYKFKSGVNIMFGCNNFCSYCIVPYVRGRERSREPEDIIYECKRMVDDGVVEIMLLGQNVNSYGKNLDRDVDFAYLIREIDKIPGIQRIRFMTPHPKDLSMDLVAAIRDSKHVCHHIHLPLQSGSDRILKLMNRKYDKKTYLDLVDNIRKEIPDCAITTDIIVGFPGETEEDFLETMDVVEKVRYSSAFTFQYSKRTGTPAAKMDDQISDDVMKDRFDRLLKRVQEIGRQETKKLEGEILPVLAEEIDRDDPGMLTGRLENNSVVHFKAGHENIGKIVSVKLTEARNFYYIGEMIEE